MKYHVQDLTNRLDTILAGKRRKGFHVHSVTFKSLSPNGRIDCDSPRGIASPLSICFFLDASQKKVVKMSTNRDHVHAKALEGVGRYLERYLDWTSL